MVLCEFGVDLYFVNGGVIEQFGMFSGIGMGDFFVVEVDELDGMFLLYDMVVVLIMNVDFDYFDYYGLDEVFYDVFVWFVDVVIEVVVIFSDDVGVFCVGVGFFYLNVIMFGQVEGVDLCVIDIVMIGLVVVIFIYGGEQVCMQFVVLGVYNVINVVGVVVVLWVFGYLFVDVVWVVEGFVGMV